MKILKGHLISAPALGALEIIEHGCLVLDDDGTIKSVEKAVPQHVDAEVIDYGDSDFRGDNYSTGLSGNGQGYSYPMLKTFTVGLNLTF